MFETLFDRGGLSLERLHALILLADEGSLIRAAKGDSGLQSRYSHHLKELSAYFEVDLTERVGKTVRLTASGETLLRLTREHFQSLLRFRDEVQGRAPSFRLGAGDSLLQWLVIPTIAALRRTSNNIRFVIQNLAPEEIASRLADQRLDFGLVTRDASLKGLTTKSVCRVRQIIVVPDRIASRRGMLTLRQALLDCPHASLTGESSLRHSLEDIARSLRGHFEPELQCDSVSQCVAAVQTGRFAAVLPLWSWDTQTPLPHAICEDPRLERLDRELALVWNARLMKTRGSPARQAAEELTSRITEKWGWTTESRQN
jgi:DNA-binding transcriptional LysR family regulator